MIPKFLSRLEDAHNPLLGPTLWGLEQWGMWQSPKKNQMIYITVHILATIFVFSQYVELWRIRSDLQLALRNLSITMLSTVCVVKAWTFIAWQPYWKNIIEYVSDLEKKQLAGQNKETKRIIAGYTFYSRVVTFLYWGLVTATVFAVILAPLAGYLSSGAQRVLMKNGSLPYPEIMSSYIPFDRTRGFWYWFTVIEQTLICFYGGGIVANYDSNAIVLMSFFKGQLEILSDNCSKIFDTDITGRRNTTGNIRACSNHHVDLVKYSKILDSLMSPVMFLYVIICSLMICSSAVQLNMEGTTTIQCIWILEYLIALISQLFIYCWHSNDVLYTSKLVDNGVSKSNWTLSSVKDRRNIYLLQGQLRKSIVFRAGPFTLLTVATFINILQVSYNYYTLLSNRD